MFILVGTCRRRDPSCHQAPKKIDYYFFKPSNLGSFKLSFSHNMKKFIGFHFIGSLYKMKKYKRIKKYFHFTSRSNSYKLIEICSKFYFVYEKRTKDLRPLQSLNMILCLVVQH